MPDYLDELDQRMLLAQETGDSQLIADGKVALVHIHYIIINNGLNNIVQSGDTAVVPDIGFVSDIDQSKFVEGAFSLGRESDLFQRIGAIRRPEGCSGVQISRQLKRDVNR